MEDKDLDYKITVHTTREVKSEFERTQRITGEFQSHIGHKCFVLALKIHRLPKWKRLILHVLGVI